MTELGQKRLVIVCAVACSGVAATAFLLRDRFRERWYLHALENGSDEASLRAAAGLGKLRSVRAIPALLRAYAERDPYSEGNGYTAALGEIVESDPPAVVPLVALNLEDPVPGVRLLTAFFLHGFCSYKDQSGRPVVRHAVQQVAGALDDSHHTVRAYAVKILENTGPDASDFLGDLARIVREDRRNRRLAEEAIIAIAGEHP